jgi:hypothetical protein
MFYEGHDIYSRAYSVKPTAVVTIARFVKQDGIGGVTLVTALTDTPVGIAMEEFNPNGNASSVPGPLGQLWGNRQGVRVRMVGSALVESAGVLTYGDQVTFDVNGKAKKGVVGTDKIVGEAFTDCPAAGNYVLVWLKIN